MKPKAVTGKRGQKIIIDHIEYECRNPKSGCSYRIESNAMTSSEMKPLRPDGSVVRVGS